MTEIDLSALLRPGVYVLRARGRVVWIGRAKNLPARLAAHRDHTRGRSHEISRSWPRTFDEVTVIPSTVDNLDTTWLGTCAELRWAEPEPRRRAA